MGEGNERPDLSDRIDRRRDDHPVVPRPALIAAYARAAGVFAPPRVAVTFIGGA